MKILIATGIYPPHVGGPARYAVGLKSSLEGLGNDVRVLTYELERVLPFGFRHVLYLFRILVASISCEAIIALDTVSVGFPAVVASFMLGKKIVVRTGGDFLWESYLERTGYKITLPEFYKILPELSFKERVVIKIHQFLLDYTDYIVFSTKWQRDIWSGFYNIGEGKISIIENCYYPKKSLVLSGVTGGKKVFMASARNIVLKNLDTVREAFELAKKSFPDIELDANPYSSEQYDQKLRECYAFILASISDISPNSIIEAVSYNKPFIVTKYNGISDRLQGAGITVDPLDVNDIADAITSLSFEGRYKEELLKVEKTNFVHSYNEIAKEFLELFDKRGNV